MKSALAIEPAFQAYDFAWVICPYLSASSPCYRAGAAGVLRRHGIGKTTRSCTAVDGAVRTGAPSRIARLSRDARSPAGPSLGVEARSWGFALGEAKCVQAKPVRVIPSTVFVEESAPWVCAKFVGGSCVFSFLA